MRPYPDELIDGVRHSLNTVIRPNLQGDWPRYVASNMDKVLEHLQVRWRREGQVLVDDTNDLRGVLASLADAFERAPDAPLGDLAREMRESLGPPSATQGPFPSIVVLTEENERLRRVLVKVVERIDEQARSAGDQSLEPARDEIRRFLRREVDRESELSRPTWMSFAPPKPKAKPNPKPE